MAHCGLIFRNFKRVFSACLQTKLIYNKGCIHYYFINQRYFLCSQHLLSSKRNAKQSEFHSQKSGIFPYFLSFSLMSFIGNDKKENKTSPQPLEQNQDIAELIKKGKTSLANQNNFNKAEMFYLQALHLATERKDPKVIAVVQDLLANLALNTNQLDKAEPLFRDVLKNLIATGTPQTDPSVLEISLKLACIYAQSGKKELALTGYEWCSSTCRNLLQDMIKNKVSSKDEDYLNCKALLGMILDSYGRYLHDMNDNKTALAVTLEALDICKDMYGEKDSRTLVLYNDVSSIKSSLGEYDEALTYAKKVIAVAESLPKLVESSEKAVFYANISYIYAKQGKMEDAEVSYKQALVEVSKTNDEELKSHIASLIKMFSNTPTDKTS